MKPKHLTAAPTMGLLGNVASLVSNVALAADSDPDHDDGVRVSKSTFSSCDSGREQASRGRGAGFWSWCQSRSDRDRLRPIGWSRVAAGHTSCYPRNLVYAPSSPCNSASLTQTFGTYCIQYRNRTEPRNP